MKNLFKPEDFKDIDVAVSSANRIFLFNQVLEIVNVKLNKLIDVSPTVYGYGITPMASSLWNMNGPEEERCPHTHQAKLMFMEPIVKEPKEETYIEVGEVSMSRLPLRMFAKLGRAN